MSSENYILSLDRNNIENLLSKLNECANNFRQLSRDILLLYYQLDWETACKERINEKIKHSIDCSNNVSNFLIKSSKTALDILRDLFEADENIAHRINADFSRMMGEIKSSSTAYPPAARLTTEASRTVGMLRNLKKGSTVPTVFLPNITQSNLALSEKDFKKPNITISYDNSKLGIDPRKFGDAQSNTINNFLNFITSAANSARVWYRNYKVVPFKTTGVSFIKFVDEASDIYYIFVGKLSYIKKLDIPIPSSRNFRIPPMPRSVSVRAASEMSNELIGKILNSDTYKNAIDNYKNFTRISSSKFKGKVFLREVDVAKEVLDDLQQLLPESPGNLKSVFVTSLKEAGAGMKAAINPIRFFGQFGSEVKALWQTGLKPGIIPKLLKGSRVLPVVGIVIDIGCDLFIPQNGDMDIKHYDKAIADVIVDVAFGIISTVAIEAVVSTVSGIAAGILADMAIGAAIGTLIPIPVVGTVVGAVVGVVVGLIFIALTECLKINGKSIKDWAKEGVSWVARQTVHWGGEAIDAVGDLGSKAADKIGDGISSAWHGLFGGGKKSHKAVPLNNTPPKVDTQNQTQDLQPSINPFKSNTSVTVNNSALNNLYLAGA